MSLILANKARLQDTRRYSQVVLELLYLLVEVLNDTDLGPFLVLEIDACVSRFQLIVFHGALVLLSNLI